MFYKKAYYKNDVYINRKKVGKINQKPDSDNSSDAPFYYTLLTNYTAKNQNKLKNFLKTIKNNKINSNNVDNRTQKV